MLVADLEGVTVAEVETGREGEVDGERRTDIVRAILLDEKAAITVEELASEEVPPSGELGGILPEELGRTVSELD